MSLLKSLSVAEAVSGQDISIRREIVAGLTTFFTMSYIVFVNPIILANAGMPISGVLTATVMLCFVTTLLMGVFAKLPYALAPGMGLNAFFAFSMVLGHHIPWQQALGIVFWEGIICIAISVTPIRSAIVKAFPHSLKVAAAAGIGLFLCFIGLKNCGLVVANASTFVAFGGLTKETLLAIAGIFVILALVLRKSQFAFLAGLGVVTGLALWQGMVHLPDSYFTKPDWSLLFQLDILGSLKLAFVPALMTLVFTDMLDSLATFVGVSQKANLLDEDDHPLALKPALIVDSLATWLSSMFGSSPATTYIESSAGIAVGGRTGLTAIVCAFCFLPCLFIAPLVAMAPPYATGPVLFVVGLLMCAPLERLNMRVFEEAIPALIAVILIPLTFSITQGLLWGFISHVFLYLVAGRWKDVHPVMYGLAGCSVFLLVIDAGLLG